MVRHTGEYFVDEEGVAESSVLSFQSADVYRPELNAPEADGLVGDSYASFGKQVFNIAMAEVKSVVQPDGVRNDIGWESMAFVGIHSPDYLISVS
jgi:hypothetical protein